MAPCATGSTAPSGTPSVRAPRAKGKPRARVCTGPHAQPASPWTSAGGLGLQVAPRAGLLNARMVLYAGVAPGTPKHEIPLYKKIVAGAGAGALSSAVANPTDLVKVRLQTDGQLKGADGNYLPKKYTGMGHAFSSIVKAEGVLGLWKGVGPTCGRATALAAAELATYDEVKSRFLHMGIFTDGLACTLATAFVSACTHTPPHFAER